jgi:hypothetical protein
MSNQKNCPGCFMVFSAAIANSIALDGAFIMLTAFNVIPANPASFHTPRRMVATAGVVFLLREG